MRLDLLADEIDAGLDPVKFADPYCKGFAAGARRMAELMREIQNAEDEAEYRDFMARQQHPSKPRLEVVK